MDSMMLYQASPKKNHHNAVVTDRQCHEKNAPNFFISLFVALFVFCILLFSYFYYIVFWWSSGNSSGYVPGLVMPLSHVISDVGYYNSYHEKIYEGTIKQSDALNFAKEEFRIDPKKIENAKIRVLRYNFHNAKELYEIEKDDFQNTTSEESVFHVVESGFFYVGRDLIWVYDTRNGRMYIHYGFNGLLHPYCAYSGTEPVKCISDIKTPDSEPDFRKKSETSPVDTNESIDNSARKE